MRITLLILTIPILATAAVVEPQPAFWATGLIDDGFALGLDLDFAYSINYAWGATFGVGLFDDYYAFYPGTSYLLYLSQRSRGPVRLFINGKGCLAIGASEKENGDTDLVFGAAASFTVGGDLNTSSNIVPFLFLGGFVDRHTTSDKTITALSIGAGLRF